MCKLGAFGGNIFEMLKFKAFDNFFPSFDGRGWGEGDDFFPPPPPDLPHQGGGTKF